MDSILVKGNGALKGVIPIAGAKNACLTLMPATLLSDEPLTLTNAPRLSDIRTMTQLLGSLGAEVASLQDGQVLAMSSHAITNHTADYDIVRKMRASILVLGPMLARAGEATVSLPGGCAIGNRPIDLHLKALEAFGVEIEVAAGYVKAIAKKGIPGGTYTFPGVSVGATENALMAASLAKGTCVLHNAAREPEIVDLCNLLVAMGAQIEGIGTSDLIIQGRDRLHGATYRVMSDRIEAGSYACAAAMTGGDVELVGAKANEMGATLDALRQAGVKVEDTGTGIRVSSDGELKPVTISTAPYPGFATDMQAQFMAMLCMADGASVLTETIFENRYMHVPELNRMGAHIETKGRTAIVHGVKKLTGAPVMATDLRASMSLVIAGLVAEGETHVSRLYHLDRGYERLEEKLQLVGADVERVGAE